MNKIIIEGTTKTELTIEEYFTLYDVLALFGIENIVIEKERKKIKIS